MSAAALATAGTASAKDKSPRPLRILVLGGTKFLGVHVTQRVREGDTVWKVSSG